MRLSQVLTDYIRRSILTIRGDIAIRGDSHPERLAAGAENTYLRGNGVGLLPSYEVITPEAWIAPALLNSWVFAGAPANPAGYYKDKFNVVHLRGCVKNGVIGSVIFNLPVGYRPVYKEYHSVISSDRYGEIWVFANGDVQTRVGVNIRMGMDGITFRVV